MSTALPPAWRGGNGAASARRRAGRSATAVMYNLSVTRQGSKHKARRGGGGAARWLVAAAAVVWLIAGYFALRGQRSLFGNGTVGAGRDATPDAARVARGPSDEPSAALPDAAAPDAAAAPSTERRLPEDVSACVAALFAPDTFKEKKPAFDFVCRQADPLKGGTAVRTQIVLTASGGVTEGMREWAGLEWYEMAAYALLRASCCGTKPKLAWSFSLAFPVDETLRRLERAIETRDRAVIERALEGYSKQARCLNKFGQAQNFAQTVSPGAGISIFRRLLGRALGDGAP